MSQRVYHYNITKNEYVFNGDYQGGNGGYRDILRGEFPRFLVWLMSSDWQNDSIQCIDEKNILFKKLGENITFEQQEKYKGTLTYIDWKKEEDIKDKMEILGQDIYKVMKEKIEHPLFTRIKPFYYQYYDDAKKIAQKTGLTEIEVKNTLSWIKKLK